MSVQARSVVVVLVLVALAACARSPGARTRVEAALERVGGREALARAGGVFIESAGTLDRGAERQGTAPGSADPGPYREVLAWRPGEPLPRVAWEYRHERTDGTLDHVREIYAGPREKHIVVLADGFAVTLLSDEHRDARGRLLRRLLPELLAELLDSGGPLTLDGDGDAAAVAGRLDDGTPVRLELREGLPARLSYQHEVPTFGTVDVTWGWSDYRQVEAIGAIPHRYTVDLGSRRWIEQEVTAVGTGEAALEPFAIPADYEPPQEVELPAAANAAANARVEQLADGLWRVRNLRTGFHPWFVELPDGVAAIDAPAGYPLLGELPAGDVAPGPDAAWLSRRFVELIGETVPGKPISHVVVTHFHGDHAGGLEAFAAAGAEIVAPEGDAAAIREWLASAGPEPVVTAAADGHTLGDGRLVLREVGDNPHTRRMLAVWLPDPEILLVSDLFTPVAPERYPLPSHARLDRAFGDWLSRSGLLPDRIYSMHSAQPGGAAHLDRLRPEPSTDPQEAS